MSVTNTPDPGKLRLSAALADDVERYLAEGGRVRRLAPGESAVPLVRFQGRDEGLPKHARRRDHGQPEWNRQTGRRAEARAFVTDADPEENEG